jgi:hypothetical protein
VYLLRPLIEDNPIPTVVPVATNHFTRAADECLLELMRVPEGETLEERLDRVRRLSRFIPLSEDREPRSERRLTLPRPLIVRRRRLIHRTRSHSHRKASADGEVARG